MTNPKEENRELMLIDTIKRIESNFPLDYSEPINSLFVNLQKQLNNFEILPKDIIERLEIKR